MEQNQKNKTISASLIILALIVIGVLYSQSSEASKLLVKYNLAPKEETFTELYFMSYSDIALNDNLQGKIITFPFVIHNLEGKDMSYKYSVYFQPTGGQRILLNSDTVFVKNEETKIIKDPYMFAQNREYGTFVVRLDDLNQEIFFSIPTIK